MIGFDAGTYNLVVCKRDKDNNFVYKKEINAFIEIPIAKDRFIFNMMRDAKTPEFPDGVPLIEWKEAGIAYALGEAAVKFAYTLNDIDLKRPMVAGCLNPKEKNSQQIMNIMVHSLIESCAPHEVLYYSIPANAVNVETDADYHSLVLKSMFEGFEDDTGNKVNPFPLNEGLALVYAELQSKAYTGVGISCGAGMVNVCFAMFGAPIFQFSLVNSGDWIDQQAAKAVGESPTFINQEKLKLNLNEPSNDMIQKAIAMQYEIMIQKTVGGIKKGLEESKNKARAKHPIDVVVAGGTSMPLGFDKLLGEAMRKAGLPMEIGEIIRPNDPLYSVARGCLLAAEASQL